MTLMSDLDDRIYARCAVIAELVQKMQPMYAAAETIPYQRQHIETIVGAGLWYIPNRSLWTGFMSVGALQSFHPSSGEKKPKLTQDHQYPRKVAARQLLERDWAQVEEPASELTLSYLKTYGRFNYVTPRENRALMPFQRAHRFESPEAAYREAGVRLLKVEPSLLALIKARDGLTIERLLDDS